MNELIILQLKVTLHALSFKLIFALIFVVYQLALATQKCTLVKLFQMPNQAYRLRKRSAKTHFEIGRVNEPLNLDKVVDR